MRLVIVRTVDREGKINDLWLITDRLDLDADLRPWPTVILWTVELFFRWLKCILGARHLIAQSQNGVTLQMYAALIVSLLIVLRTGRKPTKLTFETIQFYLLGWAATRSSRAHLSKLKEAEARSKNELSILHQRGPGRAAG